MEGRPDTTDGRFGLIQPGALTRPLLTVFALAGLILTLSASHPMAQQKADRSSASETEIQMAPQETVFISGHSLLSDPIPSDLAAIASSLERPFVWK